MIDGTKRLSNSDSTTTMKLFLTVAAGLLALTLGATSAQAKDKHKKHDKYHHDDHGRDDRRDSSERYGYHRDRAYGSQPYYYSRGTRYYSYDREPENGRYYYPRPTITLQFGR